MPVLALTPDIPRERRDTLDSDFRAAWAQSAKWLLTVIQRQRRALFRQDLGPGTVEALAKAHEAQNGTLATAFPERV